jgi:Cu-Zn family superoxide dismutase
MNILAVIERIWVLVERKKKPVNSKKRKEIQLEINKSKIKLIILFINNNNIMTNKPIIAVAVFNSNKIKGVVHFVEDLKNDNVIININIHGLKKNGYHGFHVHEAGDLTDECTSMCAHFNPYHKNHGCPGMKERHVGDLGNLKTNSHGEAVYTMVDDVIKLRGTKANIIGRGLIIHADPDDCGQGGQPDSLTTGHAGKRIACAVIGYAKENCHS